MNTVEASTLKAEGLGIGVPGRTLLDSLDLAIRPGECWAVLGANGAGKSSLLAALAGLAQPARGRVSLGGRPLADWPRRALAREVGVLLQDAAEEFWGSVLDYVVLGGYVHGTPLLGRDHAAEGAARAALAEVDLASHAMQAYRTLSGGERQRARIAQLIVQDPAVWLLDEPLSHLDLAHQLLAMELAARQARAGRAVVMALHEPMWAGRYCARMLLLYDSGRFAVGAAQDVMTQANLEAAYGCRLEAIPGSTAPLYFPVPS